MKVTFTWQNAAGVTQKLVLGDDTLSRGPGSMAVVSAVPNWEQLLQVQEFLRGSVVTPVPRGNARRPFSLAISREFSSNDEAVAWMVDHPAQFPADSGAIEIRTSTTGSGRIRTLSDAVLQGIQYGHAGASVAVNYTFLCSEATP
jgi:hypothetical protein